MPRRSQPDPLALAVGQRIRQLRLAAGLTIEKLAYESGLDSKGHLSSLEKGLVMPTVQTLQTLADGLGVLVLDLVTFPERDTRQHFVDRSRALSAGALRRLIRDADSIADVAPRTPSPPKRRPRTAR